jgi:hypothetical protein
MLTPRSYTELRQGDVIVLEGDVLITIDRVVKKQKTFTVVEGTDKVRYTFDGLVFTADSSVLQTI